MTSGRPKVFGLGLPKTGTTTLGHCLKRLGFNHYDTPWSTRMSMLEAWRESDEGPVQNAITQYDSFEDLPWPLMYRWLDEQYPSARFILTTRADSATWLRSIERASSWRPSDLRHSRRLLYGHPYPRGHEQAYSDRDEAHARDVREYFRGRSRFRRVVLRKRRWLGAPLPVSRLRGPARFVSPCQSEAHAPAAEPLDAGQLAVESLGLIWIKARGC